MSRSFRKCLLFLVRQAPHSNCTFCLSQGGIHEVFRSYMKNSSSSSSAPTVSLSTFLIPGLNLFLIRCHFFSRSYRLCALKLFARMQSHCGTCGADFQQCWCSHDRFITSRWFLINTMKKWENAKQLLPFSQDAHLLNSMFLEEHILISWWALLAY